MQTAPTKTRQRYLALGALVLALSQLAGCGEVVEAADASNTSDASTTIDAFAGNTAPVIDPLGDQEAQVGIQLAFTLTATDAQNDTLSWTAANLPPNASFDGNTGRFSWTPTVNDLARFEPSFTVSDDGTPSLSSSVSIPIEVRGAYVRVRVSVMTGTEPAVIDSVSHPTLFQLHPDIEFARLEAINPAAQSKNPDDPATWRAAMTPVPPTTIAGHVSLSIRPKAGTTPDIQRVIYTTSAKFDNNPSSFGLFSSEDAFTTALATIALDAEHSGMTPLPRTPGEAPLEIRWVAGNAFGEFGGGQAGFSTNDLIVGR